MFVSLIQMVLNKSARICKVLQGMLSKIQGLNALKAQKHIVGDNVSTPFFECLRTLFINGAKEER